MVLMFLPAADSLHNLSDCFLQTFYAASASRNALRTTELDPRRWDVMQNYRASLSQAPRVFCFTIYPQV